MCGSSAHYESHDVPYEANLCYISFAFFKGCDKRTKRDKRKSAEEKR